MRFFNTLICFALAWLIPATALAQHFPTDQDLMELIKSRVEEGRSVGIVLGVMEADGSTRVVSYGDAGVDDLSLGERALFEIGSITKAFTGVLLADMVARGEVSLSDPVSGFLPDGVTVPRASREITLLDLATHHSGLPRIPENMSPANTANPYADYTVDQLYAFLSNHELRRDVGSEYEYSNLGFGLLGHVLARAAGVTYEDLVRGRILEPLGMSMTGITLDAEMLQWMVAGHDQQGERVPLWDLPTLAGAGALRSNIRDMLAFLAANIGPPTSQLERSMHTSHQVRESVGLTRSVGLGWLVRSVGEQRIVWHNGGTAGFRTIIAFDPDAQVGVIVLTNSAHGADDIAFHLINPELPLALPPTPPRERDEIAVAEHILETYVGEYQLAPSFSIIVTLEDGALFAQATGQSRFPIFAESETEFFYRVVDAQITFERDENGIVTGMVLYQAGQNFPGQKVR